MMGTREKEKNTRVLVNALLALLERRYFCTEVLWRKHNFRKILWENGLRAPCI